MLALEFCDRIDAHARILESSQPECVMNSLQKFGVRSNDEINLVISKERYDDFIIPLLKLWPEGERKNALRPQEGDLIWFPLDESLFEIKYVEGKKPFYQ